jgi:hypothetical protein
MAAAHYTLDMFVIRRDEAKVYDVLHGAFCPYSATKPWTKCGDVFHVATTMA